MNKQEVANKLTAKGLNATNINGVVTIHAPAGRFDEIRSLASAAIKEIGYMCSWGIVPIRRAQEQSGDIDEIHGTPEEAAYVAPKQVEEIATTEDETGQFIFV